LNIATKGNGERAPQPVRRVAPFAGASIGLFGMVSGLLSLVCRALLEGPAVLSGGDARQIGVLSFLTPLLSTVALLWVRSEASSLSIAAAALLIVGAAVLGSRAKTD
jgi:hypothetical protein